MSSNAEASSSASTLPASPATTKPVNPLNPDNLKPYAPPLLGVTQLMPRCCACPETKAKRDDCFLRSTPEEAEVKCKDLLEAHKACMRGYGFKVQALALDRQYKSTPSDRSTRKRKEPIGMVCISRLYSIQCITAHYDRNSPKQIVETPSQAYSFSA